MALTRNSISLIGSAVVTASAILIVTLFMLQLFGYRGGPYLGILAYLILPAIFLVGLLLIPAGIALQRRRDRAAEARGEAPAAFPVLDFNDVTTRRRALVFTALTAVNIVILAVATYEGVGTMETTQFCGQACHSVMQPEYTGLPALAARQRALRGLSHRPRRRLVRQVEALGQLAVDLGQPEPLSAADPDAGPQPAPGAGDLRAVPLARQVRGRPAQGHHNYSDDEANTHLQTVLLMKVGGRTGGASQGIHWHVDPGVRIRYLADEKRETVYEVEMTAADGKVTRFVKDDPKPPAGAAWRVMDCVDCHNRPSHTFRAPEQEVDMAMQAGRIPTDLPFVHRESVRLLTAKYASHEAAEKAFNDGLLAFYRKEFPQIAAGRADAIRATAAVLGEVYSANVYPSMNIGWGTYPNHIGHERSPGCFRCHDEEHKAADGRAISQDCSTCHGLLAMQEENPEILSSLQQ